MNLTKQIQALTHQELQTLLLVAFEVALQGDAHDSLTLIGRTIERQTLLNSGVLFIAVTSQELFVVDGEVKPDVEKLLRSVQKGGKPFVQTAMSQEKRVALRAGETFLAVPLFLKGEVIGSLAFCARGIARRDSLNHQILFLESFAELIATTVVDRMIRSRSLKNLQQENAELRESLRSLEDAGRSDHMVGDSLEMRRVYREIAQVAPSETTTLIRGETGTGKELVAKAIHEKSSRSTQSFVAINCAALPENLLESELFGYEKGAFTGANQSKKGSFELAHGGTLFLDEIGEMSLNAQSRLLRVLQEKEIQPVGGYEPRKVDVRLLCATNKNLEDAVESGSFRADLYYRINVFPIALPSLQQRITDVPSLISLFIEKYRGGTTAVSVSEEALLILGEYSWPGNVRELENVVQRALLVAVGEVEIGVEHLPHLLVRAATSGTTVLLGSESFEDQVGRFERDILEDALSSTGGSQLKTAELLQTSKRVVQYKIKKYGIDYRSFRKKESK